MEYEYIMNESQAARISALLQRKGFKLKFKTPHQERWEKDNREKVILYIH